jgi:hypothetical protein
MATTLKEISLTLTWLADDLGVIGRVQRCRLVDGKPLGQTFVWPIGPRIQEFLDYYQEHGHPMPIKGRTSDLTSEAAPPRDGLEGNLTPGFEATSSPDSRQLDPHAQSHSSLTSAAIQPTAAEGNRAASTATTTNPPAPGGRRRAVAAGGGASEC